MNIILKWLVGAGESWKLGIVGKRWELKEFFVESF